MNKIRSNNILLAIISGLLFIPAWYEWGAGLFLFVAFVPLLQVMDNLCYEKGGGRKLFLFSSLAFLIWNIGTTYWLKNASYAGVLAAFFLTTLFMSTPFWLAFKAKQILGSKAGFFALIIFWLAYEFAYMHGEISWPWLSLGHGFAYNIKLIQWYEYTGVFGGSLWVLIINVLVFQVFIKSGQQKIVNSRKLIVLTSVLFIPIIFSLVKYYTYQEISNPRRIVVVQPNMDPYLKFNDIPAEEHASIQIKEAEQLTDSLVDYIVTPETSLLGNFWIGDFEKVKDVQMVRELVSKYPDCNYVAGIVCHKMYEPEDSIPSSARQYGKTDYFYDYYNSAILVDTTSNIQIYHKSQLVTGIEKMPYSKQLRFLKKIMVNLGGTFRSNAIQAERSVFSSLNDSILVAPVICWESVFGEYVTDYVKKGANIIFVITNDGWWGDTPGHRQHNSLSSIRAIETRRSIARSANTGISSFINQRGDVLQSLGWWKRGALIENLNANYKITFYVKYGDYIGRVSFYIGLFLILFMIAKVLKGEKQIV